MKVLVTGFEPYGPWQRNPSGEEKWLLRSPPLQALETVLFFAYHHVGRLDDSSDIISRFQLQCFG
jgi:hypothetical protein